MKIITRGEAMRIHRQHPASRLFPFCTGKYRWHGSAEAYNRYRWGRCFYPDLLTRVKKVLIT